MMPVNYFRKTGVLMSNTYANHRIEKADLDFDGVNGTFFNGAAYLFYHKRSTTQGDRIVYSRVILKNEKGKESLETYDANTVMHNKKNYNVNGHSEISNIASVVHQGALYVFWTEDGHLWHKKTADGQTWTTAERIGFAFNRRTQFAAVSLGGRLYLIGGRHVDNKDTLVVVFLDNDGKTWRSENHLNWKNIRNVCACAYHDANGSLSIMIGIVTTNANLWTAVYRCSIDSNIEGSGLREVSSQRHNEYDGLVDFLALETGTVQDGIQDPAIQLFINGWHRPHVWAGYKNNQKKEYNIRTGVWGPKMTRSHGHTKYPTWKYMGALQYFAPFGDKGEMQQEIWLYMCYNDDSIVQQGRSQLVLCRYKSDKMKYVKTEDGTVSKEFRALIGIVEGAPPYVRNGSESGNYGSTFYYGRTETSQVAISTQFKFSAYVKAGGSLPVGVEATLKFTTEHSYKATQASEVTTLFDKSIVPVPGENAVTYIYLAPHVFKTTYEMYDWKGERPFGIQSCLFYAKKASVDFDMHDILQTYVNNPNTHNYETFLLRSGDLAPYCDTERSLSLDVTWVPGETSVFFQKKTSAVEIESSKVSAEFAEGIKNIFDIGGNLSYEYEFSHRSDVSEKVGVKLNFPFPRPDHPEDVKKYVLRMHLLVPGENQTKPCYWIPEGKEEQRPWCVAWSVEEVVKQGKKTT